MAGNVTTRVHGGDPGAAMARHGGDLSDWIDLSTGINPLPYPLPAVSPAAWAALPPAAGIGALEAAAASTYGTAAPVVAVAGAQAAIQLMPRLAEGRDARVLAPTYEEHAGTLADAGWAVAQVAEPEALVGADLAVIVNPNNPDGRCHAPEALLELAGRVGLLVVDESFADATPAHSVAPILGDGAGKILVMRSFGKFFGLAGVRLGFVLDGAGLAARLRTMAGPWCVSGPAVEIGAAALADRAWHAATRARLDRDAARLDALAHGAGWSLVGGTPLFRTYDVGSAEAVQDALAHARIWTRAFPYAPGWLRLGLPGPQLHWKRLAAALVC